MSSRLADYLKTTDVEATLVRCDTATPTVARAAATLGVSASAIVKSIVLEHRQEPRGACLAIVPGDCRVSRAKVATALAVGRLRLAPAASPRAVRGVGPIAEDDQLPGVGKCTRRGTLCQGRPLAELQPTPPLAGHRPPGHRAAVAEADGPPPPAHAPYRAEASTQDRHDDGEDESCVTIRSRGEFQLGMGLTHRLGAYGLRYPESRWDESRRCGHRAYFSQRPL